jgi:hypothetical protein
MPPVIGQSTDQNPGVSGTGLFVGVQGAPQNSAPTATPFIGVRGDGGTGLVLAAPGGAPIEAGSRIGVLGTASDANGDGVHGENPKNNGVLGIGAVGVLGRGTLVGIQGITETAGQGLAGEFQGDVHINGAAKITGAVEINGAITGDPLANQGSIFVSGGVIIAGAIQSAQKTPIHIDNGIIIDGPALTGGFSAQITGDVEVSGNIQAHDFACAGGDFAEEFELPESHIEVDLGTVMVLDEKGAIRPSYQAYDKKVVGVISGAGDYKPGIVLDKRKSEGRRVPVALVGKVFCKADATGAPIEIGDLVTTSSTPGHVMTARNPSHAFGAVIGKALGGLAGGQGLIPILVSLQ